MEAINKFIKIDEETQITENNIKREPTSEEREELWEISREFINFIYKQDLNLTDKDLRDKACHYAIVALHWNDLMMWDDDFSYSNGRFRRDTIALAICLFSRIDNSYSDYFKLLDGWILPHANWSVTLWSLRSISESNHDNFFSEFEKEDVDKCIKYMSESFRKNNYVDYNYLLKADKDHPLISYWWRVSNLLKFPNKETWEFLRRYIWNSIDLPGGLGLLAKDRDVNKDFLKHKIEHIIFPDDWTRKNKIMYLFLFFCIKTDGELADGERKVIKEKWEEWNPDNSENEYEQIFENAFEEFKRNSSIEKLYQCAHEIKEGFINQNKTDDGDIEFDKVNEQLSFILKDLMWLSYGDGYCDDEEFQFIEALRGIWRVEEKIYPDEGYRMTYNSGFDPNRRESFPEFKNLTITRPEDDNPSELEEEKMVENYYFQTEIQHWGPIVNKENESLTATPFVGNLPLIILPFPKYTENTDFKKNDLFRTFTENEIDSIVKKLKETKSCIYLTWINERLTTKLDMRGFKSPFWFMPFVCYGFDKSSFLIFEQNGIFTNYKENNEVTCILHVDFWENVSVEPGWNGLLDDWIDQGYYNKEELEDDVKNITSMRISGTNPKNNQKININIVDTHGPGRKSTLHIIKAIWEYCWQETVKENRKSSVYILPRNNEYFHSWDELLNWAKFDSSKSKGKEEEI